MSIARLRRQATRTRANLLGLDLPLLRDVSALLLCEVRLKLLVVLGALRLQLRIAAALLFHRLPLSRELQILLDTKCCEGNR
jgi:hypothetical protein